MMLFLLTAIILGAAFILARRARRMVGPTADTMADAAA